MLDNGDSLDWLNVDWLLDVVNLLNRVGVLHLQKATLRISPDSEKLKSSSQESRKTSHLLRECFRCVASPILFNQNKKKQKKLTLTGAGWQVGQGGHP